MRTVNRLGFLSGGFRLSSLRLDRSALRPASRWDVALAVVATLFYLATMASEPTTTHAPTWWIGAFAWLISLISIAWRTKAAWIVLALSLTAALVQTVAGGPIADIAVIVALYTIGVQETWRRAAVAWALSVLVIAASAAPIVLQLDPSVETTGTLIPVGTELSGLVTVVISSAVIFAVPTAIGLWLGARRAYVRTLLERTAALERERDLLQRERDLQAEQAVAVERTRIARELHDVVAHHVSVMVIQANAAEGAVPAEDTTARQALGTIGRTGHEAMVEMRRLLGLLRSEGSGGSSGATAGAATDARTPQPGLENLPALVARIREAGVDAVYAVSGHPRPVPRAIELSAYRVAQEGLTNTLRHAGPGARARLEVRYEPHSLTVEVTDDGGSRTATAERSPLEPPGHGIVGMQERVALFGGSLDAGPLRGRGYRVRAVFPVEEAPSSDRSGDATNDQREQR